MVRYEKFDEPCEARTGNHTEMQSPGKPEEIQDEALRRASTFFCTELEAESVNVDGIEDPASFGPTAEQPVLLCRWHVRRWVESLPCRILVVLLILLDITIIVWGVVSPPTTATVASVTASFDMSLSLLFVIEVSLRLFALGIWEFYQSWYHILDAVIVYSTSLISFVDVFLETTLPIRSLRLISILRLLRVVRLVRLCTEKKNLERGVRQMVSQNKRRFQQDGFDLDLTYVTERMIAMSYPSTGRMAFYRNPAQEVVRFLDTRHKDCYKVYNLCSERSYDPSLFNHRVERYLIDDHNVPTVKEMVLFSESVRAWLGADSRNVAVVHCKGGKGRTGTMVCVWLVEAGLFCSARDSLGYFGQRRTDLRVGLTFQGVETPSQSRYVNYFEKVKLLGSLPPENSLRLRQINISGLMSVGKGNGSDLSVSVEQGRGNRAIFGAHFGRGTNCQVTYNSEVDTLTVVLLNNPTVKADTRLLFKCDSRSVPRGYENVAFYLWFHTAFIENFSLLLTREELDNPHKPKTWNVFGSRFSVELLFSSCLT